MTYNSIYDGLRAKQVRGKVRIEFDQKIPDYFVERYQHEIRAWINNIKKIGPIKTIVLNEGHAAALSPEPEQGRELLGVKLRGAISRATSEEVIIIAVPDTMQDEGIIRRHCEKMTRLGVPARMALVEPERPGLPMLPSIRPPDDAA